MEVGAEEEVPGWLADLAHGDPQEEGEVVFPPTNRVKLAGTWIGHDMSWMAVGALRVAVISLASQVAAAEASLRGAAVGRLLRGIGAMWESWWKLACPTEPGGTRRVKPRFSQA